MAILFALRTAVFAPVFALSLTACGGGDDESPSPWACYSIATDDSCECYGLEPGSAMEYDGTGISEVDDCSGYDVCMSYVDTFYEEERCDCGGMDFMPDVDEEDIADLTVVDTCPAE